MVEHRLGDEIDALEMELIMAEDQANRLRVRIKNLKKRKRDIDNGIDTISWKLGEYPQIWQ